MIGCNALPHTRMCETSAAAMGAYVYGTREMRLMDVGYILIICPIGRRSAERRRRPNLIGYLKFSVPVGAIILIGIHRVLALGVLVEVGHVALVLWVLYAGVIRGCCAGPRIMRARPTANPDDPDNPSDNPSW